MPKSPLLTRTLTTSEIVRVVYATIAKDGEVRGLSLPSNFEDLNKAERLFYTTMVEHLLTNPTSPHERLHDEWRYSLMNQGWVKGCKYCPKKRTHPDLKEYKELPYRTRLQHALAHNITLVYLKTK